MKFCLSHKKYLLAGIYIICVIFTCFNARFYHTPLAKICSVSEMETMSREGTRGAEEHYYTQKITARILNGAYKGKEITLSNEYTSSQVQTQKYHKGDVVFLDSELKEQEKQVLLLRYGLGGKAEYTQKQVAARLGISRSYVSRIEKNAIEKLRLRFAAS